MFWMVSCDNTIIFVIVLCEHSKKIIILIAGSNYWLYINDIMINFIIY